MTDLSCDVVVVGAGHNGLVAAAYLARAGLRVVVCERREVVGGAAVTEELAPGYRVSTASYSLSLLRPDVHRDLDLARHGLRMLPKDPQSFVPLPDGRHFFVWRDAERTRAELERIHAPDAEGHRRWSAFWDAAVRVLRPLVEADDPPPTAELERQMRDHGRTELWRLAVAGSAAQTVEAFFEAPEVQGVFASQGIIGTWAGVRDPGTAWVLAYHALGGELAGADGTWAYVEGGMGSLTGALAAAAREAGADIRTGTGVAGIEVDGGRVAGVRLDDGSVVRAPVVASNADPRTTFLRLVPQGAFEAGFVRRVEAWRTPGCVVKVNLAVSEIPEFTALPGIGPQQRGTICVAPSLDYLQDAYEDAAAGHPSSAPFMEIFCASAVDPTLAPPGGHVVSVFAQYAPPDTDDPAEAGERVLSTLAGLAPNLPGSIVAREILGPRQLEERFGLHGGNIFHGELVPEQCFGNRFAYATPLPGLYLCGSGARPGGCVMGAAGRNAARRILTDSKTRART